MKENIETLLEENNQRKKFNIEDRKKIEFLEHENKKLKFQNGDLTDVLNTPLTYFVRPSQCGSASLPIRSL